MGQLIYDNTLVADATSVTIDLSSTPIAKGELYEMVVTQTATNFISLYANNNQTATNYYTQYMTANGTSVSSARANASYLIAYANVSSETKTYIRLTNDGYFTYMASSVLEHNDSTNIRLSKSYATSTFTATSITQLDLVSNTNGIGTGSRIQIYKVAKKVDEVEVTGSAVTSVQFSGLSIGKSNEYLLVAEVVGGINAATKLYANNNLTDTNYYNQYLYASSTTVLGGRVNEPDFSSATPAIAIGKIKLTNDGYFIYQSNTIRQRGSGIIIQDYYGTSTFTATSITQLDIVKTTDNIGIGSKFELYKLI